MPPGVASGSSCLVVSPHLDDAVFGAWHVLASAADVRVVTVFAGVPEPGFVTALDRLRGGRESAAVMRKRRADDRAAVALAGREAVHLDLLDVDYRAFRRPQLRAAIERNPARFIPLVAADGAVRTDPETIARALAPALRDGDTVYVTASIGGHPDHADVARAGLALAAQGRDVRLYADIPYLLRHGPPSWLGGEPGSPADADVEAAFAALGVQGAAFEREVVVLDADAVERKLEAMRRYETEFRLVDQDFGGVLDDRAAMGTEIVWTPVAGRRAARGDRLRSV